MLILLLIGRRINWSSCIWFRIRGAAVSRLIVLILVSLRGALGHLVVSTWTFWFWTTLGGTFSYSLDNLRRRFMAVLGCALRAICDARIWELMVRAFGNSVVRSWMILALVRRHFAAAPSYRLSIFFLRFV